MESELGWTMWNLDPWTKACAIVLGAVVLAFLVEFVFRRVVLAIVQRTENQVDDAIATALRWPVYFTVILISIGSAARAAPLSERVLQIVDATLQTVAILLWSFALSKVGSLAIASLAKRAKEHSFIQVRTQPIFDIFSKLLLLGLASYGVLLAWRINVGAWLASAGIVGLALGFAAKDSLSNLFAGIFIV